MKKISKLIVFVAIITFAVFSQSEVLRLNYNGDNIDIDLAPGSQVNVVSSDGRVEVTTNLTAVEIGDLLGVTGTINNPSVNISVANSVLTSGSGTTILSWTIADATSCSKTGEWGTGSLTPANGNQSIGPFTGPATKTYGITCQNSLGATASDTVSVTVTDPNGVNCAVDQPPILNGAVDTTIIGNGSANADPYNGNYADYRGDGTQRPWPGIYGQSISWSLTKNRYIAAQFNSGSTDLAGRFQLSGPGFTEGQSAFINTVAISECPGDFTHHLNQPRCLLNFTSLPAFKWSNIIGADGNQFCKLEKNKTYYLNIVQSNDVAGNYADSDCGHTYCGILATQVNEN